MIEGNSGPVRSDVKYFNVLAYKKRTSPVAGPSIYSGVHVIDGVRQLNGRANDQYGMLPPSTGNRQPVKLRAASEARNTATAATSSTVFGRLMAESSVNTLIISS